MRTATGLYHHQVPVCHQVPAQQLHHQEFACLDRSPENKVPAIWSGLCPPATPGSRTGTASRGSVGGWRMTRSWGGCGKPDGRASLKRSFSACCFSSIWQALPNTWGPVLPKPNPCQDPDHVVRHCSCGQLSNLAEKLSYMSTSSSSPAPVPVTSHTRRPYGPLAGLARKLDFRKYSGFMSATNQKTQLQDSAEGLRWGGGGRRTRSPPWRG